jgi:uridine nucleosidase
VGTFTLRATTTFLSIGSSSSHIRRKGGERGGKGARNSIRSERNTNAVGIGNDDGNNNSNEPFTNDPKRQATDALLLSLLAGYSLQLLTRQKATAAFAKVNENVSNGQYYRLVTSAFLHGGLVHLFVNMYSLNAIGSAVERIFGKTHTYAAFTLSAMSGNITSYKMSKYPAVGASGAIFGLAGAFAVYLYRHKDVLGSGAEEQLNALGTSLMVNAMYGATSARVDNWAHFGGLVGGCTYAYLFGPNFKRDTFGRLKNRPIVDLR